jgi:transcriptional regulator with XRE-family HTH domain
MGWTRRNAGVTVLLVMDEHRKAAGQRLARIRDSQGLSQEELAQRAKLSVKTISRFENGRHDGRNTTVQRIAEALGVETADIIGPPPAPLGLGDDTQLDRIEAQLADVLAELAALREDHDALRSTLALRVLGRAKKTADAEARKQDADQRSKDLPG